jgi:hypothetical protein
MIPFDLSKNLSHTWFVDLDGTVFEHNSYLNGKDTLLPGVKEFWNSIPIDDFIIVTTSRSLVYEKLTTASLREHNLRFNHIIFNLPLGERIVVNDKKPAGLETAVAWNVERNKGFKEIL